MAVRPFTSGGSAGAQIAILAAVLNTAVVSILLLPVLGLLRREAFTTLKGGVTFGSKALLTLSAVLFAAGSGSDGAFGAFSRARSDEPMPQLLVYGLFLLVVFYALRCGLEGIVRVRSGHIFFYLYGTDAGLQPWAACICRTLPFSHLIFQRVLRTAARGFTLPPELLLFCLLGLRRPGEAPAAAQNAGAAVRILYRTDVLPRRFGYEAQLQRQTIHTLSSGQHFCIPPSGCSAHCCVDAGGACKVSSARWRAERPYTAAAIASAEAKPADMPGIACRAAGRMCARRLNAARRYSTAGRGRAAGMYGGVRL